MRFGSGQDSKNESFLNSRICNENCARDKNDLDLYSIVLVIKQLLITPFISIIRMEF